MHTSIHLDEFDHDLTSFSVTGMMVGWSLINHPQVAEPEASAVFRWLNYYAEGPDTIVLDKIRLQYMNFTWHEFYTSYIYVNAYIYLHIDFRSLAFLVTIGNFFGSISGSFQQGFFSTTVCGDLAETFGWLLTHQSFCWICLKIQGKTPRIQWFIITFCIYIYILYMYLQIAIREAVYTIISFLMHLISDSWTCSLFIQQPQVDNSDFQWFRCSNSETRPQWLSCFIGAAYYSSHAHPPPFTFSNHQNSAVEELSIPRILFRCSLF